MMVVVMLFLLNDPNKLVQLILIGRFPDSVLVIILKAIVLFHVATGFHYSVTDKGEQIIFIS
jgi:hypothetical protein